jgi:hypothetical protein
VNVLRRKGDLGAVQIVAVWMQRRVAIGQERRVAEAMRQRQIVGIFERCEGAWLRRVGWRWLTVEEAGEAEPSRQCLSLGAPWEHAADGFEIEKRGEMTTKGRRAPIWQNV